MPTRPVRAAVDRLAGVASSDVPDIRWRAEDMSEKLETEIDRKASLAEAYAVEVGIPQYDIAEMVNAAQKEAREQLDANVFLPTFHKLLTEWWNKGGADKNP